jgi:xanthine/uracil/vitamin C permease (AzgA family)
VRIVKRYLTRCAINSADALQRAGRIYFIAMVGCMLPLRSLFLALLFILNPAIVAKL